MTDKKWNLRGEIEIFLLRADFRICEKNEKSKKVIAHF
jgi:hypothetical protein